MALQQVGRTTHFIVRYDDTVGAPALRLAQAILATCEGDLARLAAYMPYPTNEGGGDAFKSYPLDVQIVNDPTIPAGQNTGFKPGSGWMKINTFGSPGVPITDQYARFVFVAEMAEQLMGFTGWDPGNSQGEGLSVVMAEELYPDIGATFTLTSTWLGWPRPRPDYISRVITNDKDIISFGCAITFIYFLRYQLGFSYRDICSGGTTLAARYRFLTKLNDDPHKRIGDLLDQHFGIGSITIPGDNPFPLLDGNARKIGLAFSKQTGPRQTLHNFINTPKVHVSPLFNCPAKDYSYSMVGIKDSLSITATAIGLGLPTFNWHINGLSLPFSEFSNQSVDAPIDQPDPKNPRQPLPSNAKFHFDYKRIPGTDGVSETLVLTALTFDGDYHLALEVSASDHAKEPPAKTNADIIVHTCEVVYEPNYYTDLKRCEDALNKSIGRKLHATLTTYLDTLKNLPDPPQPGYLPFVIKAVDGIRSAINTLAVKDQELAVRIAHYAGGEVGLPVELFLNTRESPRQDQKSQETTTS